MKNYSKKFSFSLWLFICLFLFIVLSKYSAQAQQVPPTYGYIELVDFKDSPVEDATISYSDKSYYDKKTDKNGQVDDGIPLPFAYFYRTPTFYKRSITIKKSGYYSFIDHFGIFRFLRSEGDNNKNNPIKIELLKIPKTLEERIAIGDEQLKREFFFAANEGDLKKVRKSIKSGLSPNLSTSDLRGIPTDKDIHVITYAVRSGNALMIRELLSDKVLIKKKHERKNGVLADYLRTFEYKEKNPENIDGKKSAIHLEVLKLLIKTGANPDGTISGLERTALMIASNHGYIETIKFLIDNGALVNAKDYYGYNAFLLATIDDKKPEYRIEIAKILIKAGAEINNFASSDGRLGFYGHCKTPLAFAAMNGDLEMIKLLLKNKADVNLTCEGEDKPLDFIKNKHIGIDTETKQEIIRILKTAGAK